MGLFSFLKSPQKTEQIRHPEWDGQPFDLADLRVPAPVREDARALFEPGSKFYYTETVDGGEWWLMSKDGELIEVFWLE